MNRTEQISELTKQMVTAAGKGDYGTVKDLSGQIQTLSQTATFEKAWGFEQEKTEPAPNAFEKAWGISGT